MYNINVFVIYLILSYLFGSLNTALIISKFLYKKDIREYGSNNSGATNMYRTFGKKIGYLVFLIDIFKVIILILLFSKIYIFSSQQYNISYVALFVILGQCFPVFFNFKGGKGAASTLGMLIIIYPKIVIISALMFILILKKYNMISLAALISILLSNILILIVYPENYIPFLLVTFIVFFQHKTNIKKIINKEESLFIKK